MADRKKYFADYYQKNKKKMDKATKKYYKKRGKRFKQEENLKYRNKVNPDRDVRLQL